MPPTHRISRDNPIEGGYVHSIRPGIYTWVVVLDFKSMYPSIIISRNICFTTLSPTGATVSPSGARFVPPEVRVGIVPEILRELLADRDRFRRQQASAASDDLREYYDGLQNAVKILMNSFYGVLASSFYRFTDKEIGSAITSFAREEITSIIRALESDGHEVVYSDTDSVFVRPPSAGSKAAREFGESISKRFTVAGVTFEFQSVYAAFFSHGAKKRYVGRTAWPKEELVIRGYETRRTDAFDFQSEALLEVFDLVLEGDTDGAVARSRELVQAWREGQVPAGATRGRPLRATRSRAVQRGDPRRAPVPPGLPPAEGGGVRRHPRDEGRLDRHRRPEEPAGDRAVAGGADVPQAARITPTTPTGSPRPSPG